METVVRHKGRRTLPAYAPAGLAGPAAPPSAGSDRPQHGLVPGARVHVRMLSGDGDHCWSRFPWRIVKVAAARDGGDSRYTVRQDRDDRAEEFACGPDDVRLWQEQSR